MNIVYLLTLFLAFVSVDVIDYFITKKCNKKWWKKWDEKKYNFPLCHKGRILWYSRSVATSLFVFAKDEQGELYVLANKRGKGTPDYQGYWNVICGYLDYNESGEQCVVRECKEETGIIISEDNLEMIGVETSPSANKQNVSIRYMALLNEVLKEGSDLMKFDTSNSETDEVEEIKWINTKEIDKYQWAFNHDKRIKEILEKNIKS